MSWTIQDDQIESLGLLQSPLNRAEFLDGDLRLNSGPVAPALPSGGGALCRVEIGDLYAPTRLAEFDAKQTCHGTFADAAFLGDQRNDHD